MKSVLLVGAGGFVGSALRHIVGTWVQRLADHPFPHGILAVNLVGCLLIGLVGGLAEHRGVLSPEARLFLLVGTFGGFTTFSSFGYDTLALLRGQQAWLALSNVVLHVVFGLAAVWCGLSLANLGQNA